MANFSGSKYHKGDRHGRLVIAGEPFLTHTKQQRKLTAVVLCDCGRRKVVYCSDIKKGSCGCTTVISRGNLLRRTWSAMVHRCTSPTSHAWDHYGGRGITVCQEWLEFEAFSRWSLANGYDKSLTIDRIDNDGNYEPSNCRWVTTRENNRNRGNLTHRSAFGETKILIEWAEDSRCAVPYVQMVKRLEMGWDFERALMTPLRQYRRHKEVSH